MCADLPDWLLKETLPANQRWYCMKYYIWNSAHLLEKKKDV